MKKRIIGIDVARSLAIFGMILVNFKLVFGSNGSIFLNDILGLLEGKAAAVFVVLAGIGVAFMTNSAIEKKDDQKLKNAKIKITKRALFLFIIGLLYLPIWPADILHFYGIYLLITLFFISQSLNRILAAALIIIFSYPFLMLLWDYDLGWNFETFHYSGFWSVEGFFRNLFYNGFHPVIPWTSFMLIGLWYGKQDLNKLSFVKKSAGIAFIIFLSSIALSKIFILLLSNGSTQSSEEISIIFGTSPMPPLPLYMISGSSFAIFIIATTIIIAQRYENLFLIQGLKKTGQLALTFYVAHVILGMGVIDSFFPEMMGKSSIEFSIGFSLGFCLACFAFALLWKRHFDQGPLEWVMRKFTA